MDPSPIRRLGLVVHPRREIGTALGALHRWTGANGADLVQVPASGQERQVADPGEADTCDLVVALGGDGTTLAAIGAASPAGKPVLGAACGSLGALTAVPAPELPEALDRFAAGDWLPRRLPSLAAAVGGEEHTAVNDLVVVRQGAGQVIVEIRVDGELFVRFGGDGVVVATPLGSSAYTLAAGGPMLAPAALGLVATPLAVHGGFCPPIVTGSEGRVELEVDPGHGGARLELDGQIRDHLEPLVPQTIEVSLRPGHGTLVTLDGAEQMLAGLRRRRVLIDSPRVLARDDRTAAEPV
jgi:NAD+ kinase